MSLQAKYHYTHFLYPFVIENTNFESFLGHIIGQDNWTFTVDEYETDEEMYNFFLPYMRKFLFPTLFWSKDYLKTFKNMSLSKKIKTLKNLSCASFNYNLDKIKTGDISTRKNSAIRFDITNIRLITFESGICFLDIKAEIDDNDASIDFNKILDFNHYFRTLTPKISSTNLSSNISGNNINKLEDIAIFINSILAGFETNDIDKVYYDKMFTYSYACVDSKDWANEADFENIKNDFYKFQYVMEGDSSAQFNKKDSRIESHTYSRWVNSAFGFSKESGVILVSDKEKYNITKLPYYFEKSYMYMLLISLYQRISLINFSQDLLKQDKTMVKKLHNEFTKFTHFSWFSQITNSEQGMGVWDSWQEAFGLTELFDEVHKEYQEYYDFVMANGQLRFNTIVLILTVSSIILSGISIQLRLSNNINPLLEQIVISVVVLCSLIYPIYLSIYWIVNKFRSLSKNNKR